jgi:hypothetical protein
VGTNTSSLELLKLLLNSVLSWKGACLSSIDLRNFYLDNPMPNPEYVHIKISDIPNKFINKYKITVQNQADGFTSKSARVAMAFPKQAS